MRLSSSSTSSDPFAVAGDHARHLGLLASGPHNALVGRFVAARAFADRHRYGLFLRARYRFAVEQSAFYGHSMCVALFPDFDMACDLWPLEADLRDLRQTVPCFGTMMGGEPAPVSLPELCGRLFVSEGMRLMLPWFAKQTERIGFDERHGARHLACDPAKIRMRWAGFVSQLNAMPFSVRDLTLMAEACERAMRRVGTILDEEMSAKPEGRVLHG